MRININELGIYTRMVKFGNRIEMFHEGTDEKLIGEEKKLLYISCEAYAFRRHGFVVVYRDENSRYGLMTLKPINTEGYWTSSPVDGSWTPKHAVGWHVELWNDATIARVNAKETIYGLDSGWFGAYGVKTKFDYAGRFKSDEYRVPYAP